MATIITGSYTSTGAARIIDIPSGVDKFEIYNYTNQGSTANPGVVKKAVWIRGMAAASAFVVKNTNGAATDASSVITTGGFTEYDDADPTVYAAKAVVGVSQASPAVVEVTAHGYATGDFVRLTNLTAMHQLDGYLFQITVIDANTFSIPVDTSGFAAAATGGSARKVQNPGIFKPADVRIVGLTAASSAVISTNVPHNLTVGAKVSFRVPSQFGMTQMDTLVGEVTAVGSTLSYTVDIDSSAFTAFAFPASAAQPFTPAQALPIGEQTILTNAEYNDGKFGLMLGTAVVGAASDVVYYVAYKAQQAS